MRFSGKSLRNRILVWLAAEILLTSLGTDDLADYSEFIFEMNLVKIEIERRLRTRYLLPQNLSPSKI